MSEVRMALRDASWWPMPDTRSPKVYHVVAFPMVAACNGGVPLDSFTESSLAATHVAMRCRRRGCANRWRAVDHTEGNDER